MKIHCTDNQHRSVIYKRKVRHRRTGREKFIYVVYNADIELYQAYIEGGASYYCYGSDEYDAHVAYCDAMNTLNEQSKLVK